MKLCHRCRKEKPDSSFVNEALNDHVVCNRCRSFMQRRLQALAELDVKIHEHEGEEMKVTHVYLERLRNESIQFAED